MIEARSTVTVNQHFVKSTVTQSNGAGNWLTYCIVGCSEDVSGGVGMFQYDLIWLKNCMILVYGNWPGQYN